MAAITVFKEPAWGYVVVEPVERYILSQQWGHSADPRMRKFLEAIVNGIVEYQPLHAICDLSNATGQPSSADEEWIKAQVPRTAAAGCLYQIIVPPTDALTKMTIDAVADIEEQYGVTSLTVATLADALAYVRNERRLTIR